MRHGSPNRTRVQDRKRAGHHRYGATITAIDTLTAATDARRQAEADRTHAYDTWLAAVHAALDAGYDTATIGRAAGISHQRVTQLKQARERGKS